MSYMRARLRRAKRATAVNSMRAIVGPQADDDEDRGEHHGRQHETQRACDGA